MSARKRSIQPLDLLVATIIATLTMLGASPRWGELDRASAWYDEILHFEKASLAADASLGEWLTGLEVDGENGPLYYASQLAARRVASGEKALRLVPALVSVATIPVLAGVAWLVAGRLAAVFCALFCAVSPLAVYYAREGRPYSALMLGSALLLVAFVRRPDRVSRVLMALSCVALAYTAVHAVPLLGCVAAVAAGQWLVTRRDPSASRSASFFVVSGLVGLGLVSVLYLTSQTETPPGRYKLDREGDLETVSKQTAGPAKNPLDPLSAEALERLVSSLTVSGAEVSHLRPAVFAHLGLAVAGLIVLARRRASAAWVLAAFVALPVASGIAALAGVGHWYSPRYTSYALPPLLVLVGVGTAALGEAFGSLVSRWAPQVAGKAAGGALALGLALPLAAANWRAATSEPFAAYDWRTPARFLERYANEGETILAKDFWSKRALGHYLGGRRGLSVDTAGGLEEAKRRARDCGACWLVIGGVDPRRLDVRNWMSGHYRLMSDGREDFGLFFYPDHRTFLATHFDGVVGEEMTEYFRARRRLEMGGDERFFIGDGWSFEERDGSTSFRWAAARAEVALVADEAVDSVLRFRARRFPHPEAPSQHVEVRLGDRPLATVELVDEWRDYSIYAPASALSPGIVFTTFVFSSNARPDDVLDGSNDRRELSAAFDYLDLRPLHGMPSPATPQPPKE